jgi:hypothetical protein
MNSGNHQIVRKQHCNLKAVYIVCIIATAIDLQGTVLGSGSAEAAALF